LKIIEFGIVIDLRFLALFKITGKEILNGKKMILKPTPTILLAK